MIVRGGLASRLADSFETALELADGLAFAEDATTGDRTIFSARFACPVSGFTIDEIEPRLFSFNNPFGACPTCDGLGTTMHFDPDLIVPDRDKSLSDGAILGAVAGVPVETLRLAPTPALAERYLGGHRGALYLMRPDQHVAARWSGYEAAAVRAAVETAIGRPA